MKSDQLTINKSELTKNVGFNSAKKRHCLLALNQKTKNEICLRYSVYFTVSLILHFGREHYR